MKRTVSGVMLTLLILTSTLTMLTMALNIQPVRAWSGTVYIRADGSIDPPDAPIITDDYVTYTFTGNITSTADGIVVEKDNIIIKGEMFTLKGSNHAFSKGVILYGMSNVTVENVKIEAFHFGIYLDSSLANIVSGCIITHNYNGIWLVYSSNNSIIKNFIANTGLGICLENSHMNTISGNIIVESRTGVYLVYSSRNIISENSAKNNDYGICLDASSYNVVSINNMTENGMNFGVEPVDYSSLLNYVDVSNIVNGKPVYYWINKSHETVPSDAGYIALVNCKNIIVQNANLTHNLHGILVAYSQNVTIINNTIANNDRGVFSFRSSQISIFDNTITDSRSGITIYSSNYTKISGNCIKKCRYAIELWVSLHNAIISNHIANNDFGITTWRCSYSDFFGNQLESNGLGIKLEFSSNMNISKNNIVTNNYGVHLTVSSNNKFYHNNFVGNTYQIYDYPTPYGPSINVWDNGYPSGGNYWSDYTDVDEKSGPNQDQPGSDGIGDTPYVIDSNNADHYPLMNPYELSILGPPGTYVWIYWKRDNNYNFDIDLNITDAPDVVGPGQVIFWAHQFGFVNGSGGYIGLQIVGSQKKAIFSIWDAITGEPGNPFEEQGHGWQIIINYDWKLNRKYRLRIWELNVEQNGDEWWLAAVYDYTTGVDTIIGKILVPAAWGWLTKTSVTWVEYAGYDSYASRNIPYTRAVFSNPYARNPVENSAPDKLYVTYGIKPANNSDVDYYGGGTYALEAGDDVLRDTPEGWITAVKLRTEIIHGGFYLLSSSSLGIVKVSTLYSSPYPGRKFSSFCAIPQDRTFTLNYVGALIDDKGNYLESKKVELLIDGNTVCTSMTTSERWNNINMTFSLCLEGGLHNAEIRFNGDEGYDSCTFSLTVIAYKNSGFNITRDAYHFNNWAYSLDEHLTLLKKLEEKGLLDCTLEAPFILIFPILSAPGHCFGMAVSSSVYYIDPSLKPVQKDTYAMAKDDALWDIDFYQFLAYGYSGSVQDLSSALTEIKRLVDSGVPVILSLAPSGVPHAITVIGYHEESDETFLIVYDSNAAVYTRVYTIIDGNLLCEWKDKPINVTEVEIFNPQTLPKPISSINFENALKRIFELYFGIYIHCPINVEITSAEDMKLIVANNTVIRNDFIDSYVYLTTNDRLILLPANRTYKVEALGTENGTTNIECVFRTGDEILTYKFENITTFNNTRLYLPSVKSETLYIDLNGDEVIDQELNAIIIPEFPSNIIWPWLILTTLIAVILWKKSKRRVYTLKKGINRLRECCS